MNRIDTKMQSSYKSWLESQGYTLGSISSRISNGRRVEEYYGDLDFHYTKDRLADLLRTLSYSTQDERHSRPNPTRIPIVGNIRNNLASYKAAVGLYGRFAACGWDEGAATAFSASLTAYPDMDPTKRPDQSGTHNVFISVSSKDKPTGNALCAVLERNGISCWMASRDIPPGTDWGEAIVQAIKKSAALVLIFSSFANTSRHVKREVERAADSEIPIIPFRIEDVKPSGTLEYFLSTPHWLDAFTPPLEKHAQILTDTIKRLRGT